MGRGRGRGTKEGGWNGGEAASKVFSSVGLLMSLTHMVRQEIELFPLRQAEVSVVCTSVSGLSGLRGFLQTPDWLSGNPWEDWRRDGALPVAGGFEWEGELPGPAWI